jgi:hypothetical protein
VTAVIAEIDRKLSADRESLGALEGRIEALIGSQAARQAKADALALELHNYSAPQRRICVLKRGSLSRKIGFYRLATVSIQEAMLNARRANFLA